MKMSEIIKMIKEQKPEIMKLVETNNLISNGSVTPAGARELQALIDTCYAMFDLKTSIFDEMRAEGLNPEKEFNTLIRYVMGSDGDENMLIFLVHEKSVDFAYLKGVLATCPPKKQPIWN